MVLLKKIVLANLLEKQYTPQIIKCLIHILQESDYETNYYLSNNCFTLYFDLW